MNPDQTETEQRRQALVEHLRGQFSSDLPARIGIAVSGGSDSVALMHLLQDCFCDTPVELMVATVDHGLRPEAEQEAAEVADMARDLGLSHTLLRWTEGPTTTGNLQDQARRARSALLTAWARQNGIPVLARGHTADDQAETVIMRLKRAAGVNGLAGMARRRTQDGVSLQRPLLGLRRSDLRHYLRAMGRSWIEDPSNEDDTYDRIKTRKALAVLEDLGLTVPALVTVAQNMGKAQTALGWYAFLTARDLAEIKAGDLVHGEAPNK